MDLDRRNAEAHVALAEVQKRVDPNWAAAERSFRTALELNPSNEAAHWCYGVFLAAMGRHAEAVSETDRAVELDPLCLTVNSSAAWARYAARQYDDVLRWCRHTLEMEPEFVPGPALLAAAYVQTGHIREAITELEVAMRTAGSEPLLLAWLAHAQAVQGRRAESLEGLEVLHELAAHRYVSAYQTAMVYVGLCDFDAAFVSLDKACAERASGLVNVCIEPRLDPIRSDVRYAALLKRLGLPHAYATKADC